MSCSYSHIRTVNFDSFQEQHWTEVFRACAKNYKRQGICREQWVVLILQNIENSQVPEYHLLQYLKKYTHAYNVTEHSCHISQFKAALPHKSSMDNFTKTEHSAPAVDPAGSPNVRLPIKLLLWFHTRWASSSWQTLLNFISAKWPLRKKMKTA